MNALIVLGGDRPDGALLERCMQESDLTIAADTAMFGQTGPRVGSFDAGYGAGYLANIVGQIAGA